MKFEFNLPNEFWEKIVLIHWWDSNILRSLYIKYELNWSSGFRGEDVWKFWRTDGCWGRMTDRARVTGILLAHPWAFSSGELKMLGLKLWKIYLTSIFTFEPVHEISNNLVCATSKDSYQPAHTLSLIRAFASCLNILWLLSYWLNTIGVSKLKRRLQRLVWVYTCQNVKLLEITCRGSYYFVLGAQKNLPIEMIFWVPKPYVLVENMKSNFELHFVFVFFIMKPTIVLIIIILLLLISMGFHSTLWFVLLEISWFSAAVCKSNHFIIHVNCKVQSKALKSRWEEDRNTNVQAWSCEVSCVTCWQVFSWTWW